MHHKKQFIVGSFRHPSISDVLNDCSNLCVPASRNEPLSSILQKICSKFSTSIADLQSQLDNFEPSSSYTDEDAQDAIGSILSGQFTYDDDTPSITITDIDWSVISGTPAIPISSLLAATATNTIDNSTFQQNWAWDNLGTGKGLNITSTNSVASSQPNLVNIEMTGTGSGNSTSTALRVVNTKGSAGLSGLKYAIYASTVGATGSGTTYSGYFTSDVAVNTLYVDNLGTQISNIATSFTSSGGVTSQMLNTYAGTGNNIYLALSGATANTSQKIGLQISVSGGTTNNAIRTNAASFFGSTSIGAATAWAHLAATSGTTPPLKINAGTLLATPQAQAVETTTTHIYWTDTGGNRWQLDQQAPIGGTPLLPTIGTGTATGAVVGDLDGFSLTLTDVGLFRIEYANGADNGLYDFNQGVDFLTYDTDFSTSFTSDPVDGIHLNITDLNTSDEVSVDIKSDGIYLIDASLAAAHNGNVWTLVDDSTGRGEWQPIVVPAVTYTPFNATSDWTGPSGGYYSYTLVHNAGTSAIIVQVFSGTSFPETQVYPEIVERTDINTLTIRVPDSPDGRFAGNIVMTY